MAEDAVPQPPPRRAGRPRKWVDDAERQRAYRRRRAAELADPIALRADLADARRELAAAHDALRTAELELDDSKRTNAALAARNQTLRTELDATRAALDRISTHPDLPIRPVGPIPDIAPILNRQQRRAKARRRPKGK